MSITRIELDGDVAAEIASASADAGYPDAVAYLGALVRRDLDARAALVAMLRDAEAEGGDMSFDAIMADIQERRRSHAA